MTKYKAVVFDFENATTPKVAKTSYLDKHKDNPANAGFVEKTWQATVEKNPTAFNGDKIIAYTKSNDEKDSRVLKIVRSNYANVVAGLKPNAEQEAAGAKLRSHFVAGVIIAAITSDGHVVVGSRDASRSKVDANEFPAQFPCGFIDTGETPEQQAAFYKRISTPEGIQKEFVENAKREFREEVLDVADNRIKSAEFIGGITDEKKWPRKNGELKTLDNFKSFVVEIKLDMTYAELEHARKEALAQDAAYRAARAETPKAELRKGQRVPDFHEMTEMAAMSLGKFVAEPVVELSGKPRKFVAEHGTTFEVMKAFHEKGAAKIAGGGRE